MTFPAHHISVSVNCPAEKAYAFASNPENLPQWAAGLASGVKQQRDAWTAESPMGTISLRFAKQNAFGVLDHDVTIPSGELFANPMRVIPNDDGCEIVFTLFHRPEMSEEEFTKDAETISKDLQKLKKILER